MFAVAIAAACATAGNSNNAGNDASGVRYDAAEKIYDDAPATRTDASRPIDAAPPIDAPPDAPGSGGQICSLNGDCPDSGTCCFVAICVPGTGIGSDLCFPN